MFQNDGQKLAGTLCDHQFISSNFTPSYGRFYSPRYPSSYPKHVKCAYRFRARSKERIRVVFEEVTLQKGDVSCLNRADLVKVHDGRSSLSPVITVLCNEGAALEVLSTGQDLYIEFVSNSDWPGQGFKATFQFQPLDVSTTSDSPHTETTRMNVIQGSSTPLLKSTDFGPAVSATMLTDVSATEDTEVEELEDLLGLNGTEAPPTTPRSRVIVCPKGRF